MKITVKYRERTAQTIIPNVDKMNKAEIARRIGMSRSQFNDCLKRGWIPLKYHPLIKAIPIEEVLRPIEPVSKTVLGPKLRGIRKKIIRSGIKLLSWKEIES